MENREQTNTLRNMLTSYPDLPLIPLVDSDVVASDEFTNWLGSISDVRLEQVLSKDEELFILSIDEERLRERAILESGYDLIWTDEQLEDYAVKEVAAYDWKYAIVIWIDTPVVIREGGA